MAEPTMAEARLDAAYDEAMRYVDADAPNGALLAGVVGADQVDRLLSLAMQAAIDLTPSLARNAEALVALGEGVTTGVLLGYALGQADAVPGSPTADLWGLDA